MEDKKYKAEEVKDQVVDTANEVKEDIKEGIDNIQN